MSLALLPLQKEQNESSTRTKRRPVSTARSRAKRCVEEWSARRTKRQHGLSGPRFEGCNERESTIRAPEGCPDIIEDTTKAALSDGGTTTMGSCPDKEMGGEDRAAPPRAPPQKKRSSHQRHSAWCVVGVLLLALTGLGAAAERAPGHERPSVAVKRNDNAVLPGAGELPTQPKRPSAVKHSAVAAEPEFMRSVRPAQSLSSRVDF